MISKCFQFLFSSILYKIWLFNEFTSPFIMHTYSSFTTGFYIVESLKNEYNFVLIFSTSQCDNIDKHFQNRWIYIPDMV